MNERLELSNKIFDRLNSAAMGAKLQGWSLKKFWMLAGRAVEASKSQTVVLSAEYLPMLNMQLEWLIEC